ncbi:MAG: amino acid permease [Candidatus Magasanikbacteria bacterium]|nr:amino acid permease [Candidatus Magasanikbacteria bacterium]
MKSKKKRKLVSHNGQFRKQIGLFEGVALIVSATVGAGILSIPYAVAKIGLLYGLLYIFGLGILMMGLNLLIGEIAIRTRKKLQLVGYAEKYLGPWGKWLMMILAYIMSFSVLTVYIIGQGETISAILGGPDFLWSVVFWFLGSIIIIIGIRTVKKVELILTLIILFIVIYIACISTPFIELTLIKLPNFATLLLPYGVILFAYSGVAAIPEAEALLEKKKDSFKKAIIIAGLINIFIYTVFTLAIVGVTGDRTTEIATIGLGRELGRQVLIFGNLFAFFAMATSFLLNGLALRDSLSWDLKLGKVLPVMAVVLVPITIFLLGVRSFIATIDVVGGVFISLQMLLLILIYWRAKQKGDLPVGRYKLHHSAILVALLLIALSVGTVYSVAKLFL